MNKLILFKKNPTNKTLLTVLLIILSSYPPLTTDMYLPALPEIARTLNSTDSFINLTLVLFFVFFAIATLLWGPVSDKYGRKRSLISGIVLYTVSSIACSFAQSDIQLIIFRILQAIGSGAPVTISIAIVQDLFQGEDKKRILAILSALMMVAPAIAPLIGSTILKFAGWRFIFSCLSAIGLTSLIGCLFINETIKNKSESPVYKSITGVFRSLKVSFFRDTVILFSLPAIIALGFVGGSSLILISGFGVSSFQFTFYFALNACFAILGSLLYLPISKKIKLKPILSWTFVITVLSGLLIMVNGTNNPALFILSIMPATIVTALIRPLGMGIILENSGSDAGTASSVINFLFIVFGSFAMQLIGLNWTNRALTYGVITLITGIISFTLWHLIAKKHQVVFANTEKDS